MKLVSKIRWLPSTIWWHQLQASSRLVDDLINPINRAQLIDDYMNLARANMTSYANALTWTRYLVNESDYTPWAAGLPPQTISTSSPAAERHQRLFRVAVIRYQVGQRNLLQSGLWTKRKGLANDHLRPVYSSWLGLHINDCVQRALILYKLWMSDPSHYDKPLISSDLRRIISCTSVTYGGAVKYAFAFKKYRETKAGSEKNEYLRAMTCTTDRILITKYYIILI